MRGSAVLVHLLGLACTLTAAAQQPGPEPAMSLDEVVRTALERNRELDVSRLELAGSDQVAREAWGNVYPSVSAVTSFTRNLEVPEQFLPAQIFDADADPGQLIPVRMGFDNQWFGQLRLEQTLFDPAAFIGVGAANRYQSLKAEEVRGKAQQVATRARAAYYDVLLAEEAVRLNENGVERVRRQLEETQALFRAGLASDYDVLRLEVQLANLEPRLGRALSNAAAARRLLAAELGMDGGEEVRVAGSLANLRLDAVENDPANRQLLEFSGLPDPASLPVQRLLELARRQRSDLRQLELTRRLRGAKLRAEQSEYLPKVSLFGVYAVTAVEDGSPRFFGGSDGLRQYGHQVGVQVSLPLFSGFQRPARAQQRRVALRQTEVQQRLAQVEVQNELRTLRDQVIEARERAEAQWRHRPGGARLRDHADAVPRGAQQPAGADGRGKRAARERVQLRGGRSRLPDGACPTR
jgi:outer membrane protein